MEAQKVD